MNTVNIQSAPINTILVGSAYVGAAEATVSTANITGFISTLQQSNANGAGT